MPVYLTAMVMQTLLLCFWSLANLVGSVACILHARKNDRVTEALDDAAQENKARARINVEMSRQNAYDAKINEVTRRNLVAALEGGKRVS